MVKRIINTSEKRGINEAEIYSDTPEDLEEDEFKEFKVEDEVKQEAEIGVIASPDKINEETKKDSKIDYTKYIEENEEVKQYLEYKRIKDRIDNGKEVSDAEKSWYNDIAQAEKIQAEANAKQQQAMQEEIQIQEKMKEEIDSAYKLEKEKHPERILITDARENSLHGGESIIKTLKFIAALKKAKKKGGKVLVQVLRTRRVIFKWTQEEITFVEFWTKDEKGNDLLEVTRFSEYPYSFEGTPVPVLFAIQGYAEGFDFYKDFRKDLTAELLSRISTRSFITGYMKGAEIRNPQEKKGDLLAGLMPFTPLILIGGIIILAWMMYQMYTDMGTMKLTMQSLVQQAQVVVDSNALILR
jgi:hypothetical protein